MHHTSIFMPNENWTPEIKITTKVQFHTRFQSPILDKKTVGTRAIGYLGARVPRYLAGYPGTQVPGYLGTQVPLYLDTRVPRYLVTQVRG